MFRNQIMQRSVAALLITTFTSLSMYPLTAAAQAKDAVEKAGLLPKQKDEGFIDNAKRFINGLGGKQQGNAAAAQTADERFSQLLADIHEDLKAVVPQTAMSRQAQQFAQAVRSPRHSDQAHDKKSGKQSGKQTRAVGPDMRIEVDAGKEAIKPLPGTDMAARVHSIRGKAKAVQSLFAEIDKSFKETEQHLKQAKLPREILDRHTVAVGEYETRKANFVRLTGKLEQASGDSSAQQAALAELGSFMARYPNAKPHQYADPNKLPFGANNVKVRQPYVRKDQYQTNLFLPKYEKVLLAGAIPDGLKLAQAMLPEMPTAADTDETEDVKITPAIRTLAGDLEKNPVKIYNWVRNNINFVPTYGSIQGADTTLQSRRGNAFDTASLLIALYRASGIPARYVYGTIELPAEKVMNWVGGTTKPSAALDLLGQGGIPNIGIASAGVIRSIRMEHVWVEAYVNYVPSRGAVNISPDTWVPMDASLKQYSAIPSLIPAGFTSEVETAAAKYLQTATKSSDGSWTTGYDAGEIMDAINSSKAKMTGLLQSNPDKFELEQIIGGRSIVPEELSILAGSLPYKVVLVGGNFTHLPFELRVSAKIDLYAASIGAGEGSQIFTKTISLAALGYSSLNLTHAPASATDAATWDNYIKAGSQSFPAYLINVKSKLMLDGSVLAESPSLKAGEDLILKVSFSGAGFNKEATFQIIAGDAMEIGINGAGQTALQGISLKDRSDLGTATGNMYVTAKAYWTQQDFHDQLIARLHGAAITRLPSVGIFSIPLSVSYYFGIPRMGSYHSRQVDVKLSHIAAVALDGNLRKVQSVVMHSGMISSTNEGAVIETVMSKPLGHGSNTMRLLQLANDQKIPIYHLTSNNIDANRSALQHAPEVMLDIENALNFGLEVIIPKLSQTNGAWSGSGYIMLDPTTASADYRVSGGLSGNFDDDACQRAAEPIKVTLPDVAFIWWILFGWMVDSDFNFNGDGIATALATVAAVTLLIGIIAVAAPVAAGVIGAAGIAAGTIIKATFTAIALAFSPYALAESEAETCACEFKEIERRGGTSIFTQVHNACADRFTDIPGKDIKVGRVAFDGIRQAENPPGTLYEIKTGMFYSTVKFSTLLNPAKKKFLEMLKTKAIFDYYLERDQARVCRYNFRYGARDPWLVNDLQEFFITNNNPAEAAHIFSNGC